MNNPVDDKIERALSLLKNRGISQYEIYASFSDVIRAESEEAKMKNLERAKESGVAIRILHEGSMGFAYSKDPDEKLIDSAFMSAQYQFSDEYNSFPAPNSEYSNVEIFDDNILNLMPKDCIAQAMKLEASARNFDSRIQKTRKASFNRVLGNVRIVNSSGIDVTARATYCTASIMVMAGSGEDMQSGHDFGIGHFLDELDVEQVGRTASKNAISMLGAKQIKTCRMPVLFDNSTCADIISTISGAFIGESVLKGKSILKDRLGEFFFSSCITLLDNPLDKKSTDSFSFDGEGVASKKNILIEKGRVASFVYDTYWGKKAGMSSTGNSLRGSYRSSPVLGLRHIYLEPGSPVEPELKGLNKVLKVTDIMGMHTVDPISGEFSVGINGILLENGTESYPVREAAIAGNLYSMLGRVVHVGDDIRSFGSIQTPSILISEMDVSSK